MDLQQKNKLLCARAGFGISLEDYRNPQTIEVVADKLFPKAPPGALEMVTDEDWANNNPKAMKEMADVTTRKEMEKAFRQRYRPEPAMGRINGADQLPLA